MIYDLIVVGNGLAAQTFLFELFNKQDARKSQNFSVAQIYSEDIAASCSLRTTATVSLSGIEDGVSELGNELRESFFLFKDFQQKYDPKGVEKIVQVATFSGAKEKAKMIRRYKVLKKVNHFILNEEVEGTDLNSFLIYPQLFSSWFEEQLSVYNIDKHNKFLKSFRKNAEGIIECELLGNEVLKARKIVLCTGAYAKIFSEFFDLTQELINTQVIGGSYLERTIDLGRPSFYLTIDEHNLIYRKDEQKLILGSVSSTGGMNLGNLSELEEILITFNQKCNFFIGNISDFKMVTGLRHKGVRRRPIARALDVENKIFMINGMYKNGFTFSHLCAKKILSEINL